MSHWSAGYVTEVGYTHGYYREIAPSWINFALLARGIAPPSGRPLRYLELGFGQGLGLNIHAAANEGTFWGNDFNPAHAANANDLARSSGSGLKAIEASFEELAGNPELGEFDVIVLHGIWSWVSPHNHQIIVDIARRKLAVGGALYISYNCTPGWSPGIPLRHLISLHDRVASAGGERMPARIDAAVAFADKVVAAGAIYFKGHPAVVDKLAKLKDQNRNYLAHEYFCADWHVMPFSDIADRLDKAKLTFAASAHILDHVDHIYLTAEGRKLLDEIVQPVLRQTVRDYLVNQQFRKDVWIKGARELSSLETRRSMGAQRFVLTAMPAEVPMVISGPIGTINLSAEICGPVIEALGRDGLKAKSLDELQDALPKLTYVQIREALLLLCGAGHVNPAQSEATVRNVKPRTKALNAALLRRAETSSDSLYLASPVTGGGVSVNRLQQMFLAQRAAGRATPQAWAEGAWKSLDAQGQRVLKDGKLLEGAAANLANLRQQATEFQDQRIPVLAALQVA